METKQKKTVEEKIRRRCGFEFGFMVDPEGRSGGLGLWWSKEIKVEILFWSKNIIHVHVEDDKVDLPNLIAFVYGPPKEKERKKVWNQIKELAGEIEGTWMCIGDFNDMVPQDEKKRGRSRAVRKILNFQQFIADCELIDLGFEGLKYTWSNKRILEEHVKERIDRVLGNIELCEKFPKAHVFHLEPVGSDHGPVLVDLYFEGVKTSRCFRFEHMLAKHYEFMEVVRRGWMGIENLEMDGINDVIRRLNSCKEALLKWSRRRFPNSRNLLDNLLNQVAKCYEGIFSEDIRRKVEELEKLWHNEEVY